jgi:hypothetical protein
VSKDPDQERAREANRLHKALEDAGIKLDCVAADPGGSDPHRALDGWRRVAACVTRSG